MKVKILYFAQLRDITGKSLEARDTTAPSPSSLYEELAAEYSFRLGIQNLRVAVNNEFVPMDVPLQDGDEVAFIPPVAGG